jgi:DNA-binding LacI/PurR family transcriptional regulator
VRRSPRGRPATSRTGADTSICTAEDNSGQRHTDVAVVEVGRGVTRGPVDVIRNNDAIGTRQAVDHLVDLGHQTIAYIDGGPNPGADQRRDGYRVAVPGDLSVVGYDDSRFGRLPGIDLTSVRQDIPQDGPAGRQGRSRATGQTEPQARDTALPPKLVVRGTTAPPGIARQ